MNVYLTYDCFKMLCMLSQAEKSQEIRKYYVEIEKHLLSYRNEIISDLHKQIGIKVKNKNYALIYILKVSPDSDIFKFGKTKNIKKRMSNYGVGNVKEYEIMYVMKVKEGLLSDVEKCVKKNLDENTYKTKSGEIIKLDYKRILDTLIYCSNKETYYLYASSNKKSSINANWGIFFDNDKDNIEFFGDLKKKLQTTTNKKIIKKNVNESKKESKVKSKAKSRVVLRANSKNKLKINKKSGTTQKKLK